MKKYMIAALFIAATSPALALDSPLESSFDHRIRSTTFNPLDVVQINTVIGITTHIELEPGETYITHAFGDSASYSFANSSNHIFIKPTAEQANTNLIVITDRRSYKFRLIFQETRNSRALYSLSFNYPDTARAKALEEMNKKAVADGFKKPSRGSFNTQYTMGGDLDIAPINTWDNNEFTFFKFPGNVDLPGIYLVDAAGNESIVNRSAIGKSNGIYQVQKVNAKWMLRLGDRALSVYNNAYRPDGIENKSRTQSPAVKRVVIGGDE